jgi:hypothetical protein
MIELRRHHIQSLAAQARAHQTEHRPGASLWQQLVATAITAYPEAEPQQRCDWIVQDLAIVILGPFARKYLAWFDKITLDAVQDPLLHAFETDFAALGLPGGSPEAPGWREAGYCSKLDDTVDLGLDQTFGSDLRPALHDGTDNQIFHTFFYHFMAYVTQAKLTIRAASVYHELFDKGGSPEDHTAALLAIQAGLRWRSHRDDSPGLIAAWPESILAVYGDPARYRVHHPEAMAMAAEANRMIDEPGWLQGGLRQAEHAVIRWVNALFPRE